MHAVSTNIHVIQKNDKKHVDKYQSDLNVGKYSTNMEHISFFSSIVFTFWQTQNEDRKVKFDQNNLAH